MKLFSNILSILIFAACSQNTEPTSINYTKSANLLSKVSSQKEPYISQEDYELGDLQIKLVQAKSTGSEFYCKAKLFISKGKILIDSLSFTPKPVGGYYGISKPQKIDSHLVFTKHGDYDGRTLIINNEGKLFNIIGGQNFYDPESRLLFTTYESDLSGFAIFDLSIDSLIFEFPEIEETPISFHKTFGERYFFRAVNNDLAEVVMEIEPDLERVMQVDLDTNTINATNMLTTWKLEEVNCVCEK